MRGQAFLAGFGQVMRQQQDAVGASLFSRLRALDGKAGRPASARNDGHLATAGVHRRLDDLRVFIPGQREEFAGAASRKQGTGAIRSQPLQPVDVALAMEVALRIEVGQGKGQQAAGENGFEFLGIHGVGPGMEEGH